MTVGSTSGNIVQPTVRPTVGDVAGGGGQNPAFSNVKLLLNFNGPDESTTFTDLSNDAVTVTPTGGAKNDTAQFKFGTSSLNQNANGDSLTLPQSLQDTMAYATVDNLMTLEMFIRFSSLGSADTPFSFRGTLGGLGWVVVNGVSQLQVFNSSTLILQALGSFTALTDVWYHFCIEQDGRDWTIYIDGAVDASGTASNEATLGNQVPRIGQDRAVTTRSVRGWMDAVRYTQGELVYGGPFTPPTSAPPES